MNAKPSLAFATAGLLAVMAGQPASAQSDEMKFRPELVEQCLAGKKGNARLDCAGLAANDCTEINEGGGTTVGLGMCFTAESEWWDVKLNEAYKALTAVETADDLEAKEGGWRAPEKQPVLKDMQRKWIAYRDALCEYEYVQWGGGTGGGPASAACEMSETARQYFVLADRLADR